MSRYLITDEARQDLAEIRRYIVDQAGAHVAKSTLAKITASFDFLSRTPGAGHSREDLTSEAVSFWRVFSYLIVYNSAARPIEIIRVLHGRREVSAILQDE